nr:MAG TPA: hypothetical protein [Caudoviricetes sp.]
MWKVWLDFGFYQTCKKQLQNIKINILILADYDNF